MFSFLQKIKQWVYKFTMTDQSDLENFVRARNPQNAAEVDHLVRVFNNYSARRWL